MIEDEEADEREGAAAEQAGADNARDDKLLADQDVQIFQEVLRREQKSCGYPDRADIEAMEEPLYRLMGAVVLFQDLAIVTHREEPPRPIGLSFLAHAMNREAVRLYRLYHGHPPSYQ